MCSLMKAKTCEGQNDVILFLSSKINNIKEGAKHEGFPIFL